jgi:hypothetical protein
VGAFLAGRRTVAILVFIAGLILLAVSVVKNAMDYTEVVARVEGLEHVCRPAGAPIEAYTDCAVAVPTGGKRLLRHVVVRVPYRSPADDQEHSGVVIPIGGRKAVEAARLRPGDRWKILAHDKPEDFKVE